MHPETARSLSQIVGSLVSLLCFSIPVLGATAPSAQAEPAATERRIAGAAARVPLAGISNFGIVSDQLYRGAQPDTAGFAELKKLRIDIVVNLRHETGQNQREGRLVQALGMRYVNIPWRGWDEPKIEQVEQFLSLLRDNPERRLFVHCERGSERTGVMVACYRMSRDHWTPERALAEMHAFGFRSRFRHLARFVHRFPALLGRDPFVAQRQACSPAVSASVRASVSRPEEGTAGVTPQERELSRRNVAYEFSGGSSACLRIRT
jgi:protein tyrosine phosphatase (PTP) superfamily phosphohydrolase (DUF442 family)